MPQQAYDRTPDGIRTPPRVLLYYPSNARSVQLESIIVALDCAGIAIELLTTAERGPLHDALEAKGIRTHSHLVQSRVRLIYYARHIWELARFTRRHRFTSIFSNLQHANIVAVLAQYLTTADVIVFRHHFKFALPGDGIVIPRNRMETVFDRVITRLARRTVVPSTGVYNGMRDVEGANMSRTMVIPYIYDFTEYPTPDSERIAAIRRDHASSMLLVSCGRLIPYKRTELSIRAVAKLVQAGLHVTMVVIGDGPERPQLARLIREQRLTDRVALLGFRENVLDYLSASDILLHPSLTEASSNVVKEMALQRKPSLVCEGVGDFSDYLTNDETALMVPRGCGAGDLAAAVASLYADPERRDRLGDGARQAVLARFTATPASCQAYLDLLIPRGIDRIA